MLIDSLPNINLCGNNAAANEPHDLGSGSDGFILFSFIISFNCPQNSTIINRFHLTGHSLIRHIQKSAVISPKPQLNVWPVKYAKTQINRYFLSGFWIHPAGFIETAGGLDQKVKSARK